MVCLSCTGTGERVCLSAEGFGNRQCFLEGITDRVRWKTENTPPSRSAIRAAGYPKENVVRGCVDKNYFLTQNVPPDLSLCVFVIEQALSVRALQELMASGAEEGAGGGGLGSGHKTLLYGNAILLRHANSNMVGMR